MALDNTEEFFIGDFVYYIAYDGSYTTPAVITDKKMVDGENQYIVKNDAGWSATADARHLSYTL